MYYSPETGKSIKSDLLSDLDKDHQDALLKKDFEKKY